jgi:predicted transcriptional regulator
MGIKSFIGKRPKAKKGENEQINVSDYMTRKLIVFQPQQSVLEAMNQLIKNRISGAPVVNENQELVGIISEGDCIKQITESRYYNQPIENITIEEHMIKNVETIPGDMNIFDAAEKFLSSKRRRFPIVEEGKLVGQISQKDILKAALKLKGHSW